MAGYNGKKSRKRSISAIKRAQKSGGSKGHGKESVNHPKHYGGDTMYEVIKVLEAWGLTNDAYLFNVVKYIARAGKKDKTRLAQDLNKAAWYLARKIKVLGEAK